MSRKRGSKHGVTNFKMESESSNNCQHFEELQKFFEEQFQQVTGIMQNQNDAIMDAQATQRMLLKTLVRYKNSSVTVSTSFPLKTEESLNEVDKEINDDNRRDYVTAVKTILCNNVIKNLGLVVSDKVLNDFNVDGTHGKKPLKDFENIYNVILEAVGANPEIEDAEGQIRKAIHLVKKRYLKKVLKQRKKKCN